MTQQPVGYEDSDIRARVREAPGAAVGCRGCASGGVRARSVGEPVRLRPPRRTARRRQLQLVAIDLRGRGRSEVTGAGTYGWRNHARDVLGVADAVGAPSFAIIGQSSGAAIAMTCAQLDAVAGRAAGTRRSGGQS